VAEAFAVAFAEGAGGEFAADAAAAGDAADALRRGSSNGSGGLAARQAVTRALPRPAQGSPGLELAHVVATRRAAEVVVPWVALLGGSDDVVAAVGVEIAEGGWGGGVADVGAVGGAGAGGRVGGAGGRWGSRGRRRR